MDNTTLTSTPTVLPRTQRTLPSKGDITTKWAAFSHWWLVHMPSQLTVYTPTSPLALNYTFAPSRGISVAPHNMPLCLPPDHYLAYPHYSNTPNFVAHRIFSLQPASRTPHLSTLFVVPHLDAPAKHTGAPNTHYLVVHFAMATIPKHCGTIASWTPRTNKNTWILPLLIHSPEPVLTPITSWRCLAYPPPL